MNPQATAGRIVHYVTSGGGGTVPETRAAIVNMDTDKHGTAELTVLYSEGPGVLPDAPYSEEPQIGHWSWMPVPEDGEGLAPLIGRIEVLEDWYTRMHEAKVSLSDFTEEAEEAAPPEDAPEELSRHK